MTTVVQLGSRIRSAARGEYSPWRSYGLAWNEGSEQAYNQEAFRYFLEIERTRSRLSACPFLLLLVRLRPAPGDGRQMRPSEAAKLFSALRLSVRETDFIGWYREGHLAGAVLAQPGDVAETDVSRQAHDRVIRAMAAQLSKDLSDRLHVRVCRVPAPVRFGASHVITENTEVRSTIRQVATRAHAVASAGPQ